MRLSRKKILTAKLLLLGSLVLQYYMLLKVYKSIATLTSDLFEMFRPLGYPYFVSGITLLTSITMFTARRTIKEMGFNFISTFPGIPQCQKVWVMLPRKP